MTETEVTKLTRMVSVKMNGPVVTQTRVFPVAKLNPGILLQPTGPGPGLALI